MFRQLHTVGQHRANVHGAGGKGTQIVTGRALLVLRAQRMGAGDHLGVVVDAVVVGVVAAGIGADLLLFTGCQRIAVAVELVVVEEPVVVGIVVERIESGKVFVQVVQAIAVVVGAGIKIAIDRFVPVRYEVVIGIDKVQAVSRSRGQPVGMAVGTGTSGQVEGIDDTIVRCNQHEIIRRNRRMRNNKVLDCQATVVEAIVDQQSRRQLGLWHHTALAQAKGCLPDIGTSDAGNVGIVFVFARLVTSNRDRRADPTRRRRVAGPGILIATNHAAAWRPRLGRAAGQEVMLIVTAVTKHRTGGVDTGIEQVIDQRVDVRELQMDTSRPAVVHEDLQRVGALDKTGGHRDRGEPCLGVGKTVD